MTGEATISAVTTADLDALLPLMRAYCDFYAVHPPDADLRALSRALIEARGEPGVQFIARQADGTAVGFATLLLTWSTTSAARAAVMNDLYVCPDARGTGLADRLIARCVDEAAARGAAKLTWITRPDNHRAQAVYDRTARRDPWMNYRIDLSK